MGVVTAHELPSRFPIFPLPNVVLFPGTSLPLHIFEPRYREMAAHALAGDAIIGMVLLKSAESAAEARAPVFEVGCAGRVVDSQKLPDGRYNLLLQGLQRFRIAEEPPDPRSYRLVRAEILSEPGFLELDPSTRQQLEELRGRLEDLLVGLARRSAPAAAETLLERMRRLDPVQLVHALAFGLDCSALEKQGLLEAGDPLARAELLAQLLRFRQAESELAGGPRTVN